MAVLVKEPSFAGFPLSNWEQGTSPHGYAARVNLQCEFVKEQLLGCVIEAEKRILADEMPFIVADQLPEQHATKLLNMAIHYRAVGDELLQEMNALSLAVTAVGNVYIPLSSADLTQIKRSRKAIARLIKQLQAVAARLIALDARLAKKLYKFKKEV